MSMAERYERTREAKEQAERAAQEADARTVRVQSMEQKQTVSRGKASELLAALKARNDIPDVPGALPDNVVPFRETRAVVNTADRSATRDVSSDLRAAQVSVQSAELGRQQQEKIGAEARRLALNEKTALERQGYDTRNFDTQGSISRHTETLKKKAQEQAQDAGKFAV